MASVRRPLIVLASACGLVVLTPNPAGALPGEGLVSNAISSGADTAFQAAARGMVNWVLGGVAYFTDGIVNFLKTAARPQVDSIWFSGVSSPYAAVRSIALSLLVVFTLLGILSGLLQGDVPGMLRRVAGGLPAAIGGMVVSTAVVAKLLDLTDALSTAVLASSGDQSMHFLSGFGAAITTPTGGFAALILGGFAVFSAFLLWVELMIRSTLVYFLVALSPLAFAATLWPATRGILRRLGEMLAAVIVSKLAICIALAIGAAALGGAGNTAPPGSGVGTDVAATLGTLLSGAVLLTLACWSPFLLLRLIPVVESAVVAQGMSRGPVRAAQSGLSTMSAASSATRLAGVTSTVTSTGSSSKPGASAPRNGTQQLAGGGKQQTPPPTFVRSTPKETKQ